MRVAGTRNAKAKALAESPSGARNSSAITSPGCVVTRRGEPTGLMVVDDFDIFRSLCRPTKTDPPLVVDADRKLSAPIACPSFQTIARRRAKIVKTLGVVQHVEL